MVANVYEGEPPGPTPRALPPPPGPLTSHLPPSSSRVYFPSLSAGDRSPSPPSRSPLSLSRSLAIPPLFSLARPPAEASGPGRPRGRIPITSIPPDAMFSMGSGCMLPLTGHEWGRYLLVAARANGKHNIRGVWGPLECGGGRRFGAPRRDRWVPAAAAAAAPFGTPAAGEDCRARPRRAAGGGRG